MVHILHKSKNKTSNFSNALWHWASSFFWESLFYFSYTFFKGIMFQNIFAEIRVNIFLLMASIPSMWRNRVQHFTAEREAIHLIENKQLNVLCSTIFIVKCETLHDLRKWRESWVMPKLMGPKIFKDKCLYLNHYIPN